MCTASYPHLAEFAMAWIVEAVATEAAAATN
jgi:hypothetical protein